MAISWFPGHMAKTRRLIGESIKQVDIVIELCDARIPQSSRNPILSELLCDKPRILLLNKSDIADPEANRCWIEYYKGTGVCALSCDSLSGKGVEKILPLIKTILSEKIERYQQKGMKCALKAMIVGIPNVGKSSLINRFSGKRSTNVEDRPGVTRDKQWIRLQNGLELLDTPGILWPKFEDEQTGNHLAFTGAIKDDVLDIEEIASLLCKTIAGKYPELLSKRYSTEIDEDVSGLEILEAIGKKRGFLISGGDVDLLRASKIVLDEFRACKIGRITLEWPDMTGEKQ